MTAQGSGGLTRNDFLERVEHFFDVEGEEHDLWRNEVMPAATAAFDILLKQVGGV